MQALQCREAAVLQVESATAVFPAVDAARSHAQPGGEILDRKAGLFAQPGYARALGHEGFGLGGGLRRGVGFGGLVFGWLVVVVALH